jgi:glycopeptide antibiotics resistance protein
VGDRVLPGLLAVIAGTALVVVGFVPFVVRSYRRRGELGPGRALLAAAALVYSLALVAYVLLPLPTGAAEACTSRAAAAAPQLRPFAFLSDITAHATALLVDPAVLQVAFNVALFVPFGALLRHLARRSVVVTTLAGLTVSLLIEFTQLTGNWFLYPCPYRLFDVDDLIANGLGALLGALAAPVLRHLPGQPADDVDPGLPRPVTTGRRLVGVLCDLLVVVLVGGLLVVPARAVFLVVGAEWPVGLERPLGTWLPWAVLFVLLPVLGRGGTPGQRAVLLRPADPDGARPSRARLLARSLAGTGGFVLLHQLGGAAALLGLVWGVVCLVALIRTPGHRGVGGVWTRTVLLDRRAAAPAAPETTGPRP